MKELFFLIFLLIHYSVQEDTLILNGNPISSSLSGDLSICYKIKYKENKSNFYINILTKTKNAFIYYNNNTSGTSETINSIFKQIELNIYLISAVESICIKSSNTKLLEYEIQLISHLEESNFTLYYNVPYSLSSYKGERILYSPLNNQEKPIKAVVKILKGEMNIDLVCKDFNNCKDNEYLNKISNEIYFFSNINSKENSILIDCFDENLCKYSILFQNENPTLMNENEPLFSLIHNNESDKYNFVLDNDSINKMYIYVYSFMNNVNVKIKNNEDINVLSHYFDNVKIFEFIKAYKKENSLMGKFSISINSKKNSVYSIYFVTKTNNQSLSLLNENYPVLSFIPFSENKLNFNLEFDNIIFKKGAKIIFKSLNCELNINESLTKNTITKLSNDVTEMNILKSVYNTSTNMNFQIDILEMERQNPFVNEKCIFYSKTINGENPEVLLTDSNLFKMSLDEEFNNVRYNYEYNELYENVHIDFKFYNEGELNIKIMKDNKIIKTININKDTIITLKKEELLEQNETLINIVLDIEGKYNNNQKSIFFGTILSYTKLNKPRYISRNEYNEIHIQPNEEKYFYSEIGNGENGEIIFDLINFNDYRINAKLIRKTYNSSEGIFKYLKSNSNDNKVKKLSFDKVKGIIPINNYDTEFCHSGCELLIIIKSENEEINLSKFSFIFKSNQRENAIMIKDNQYYFGNTGISTFNDKNETFKYYMKDSNFIEIEIKCQYCELIYQDENNNILFTDIISGEKTIVNFTYYDFNQLNENLIYIIFRKIKIDYYLNSFYNFRIIKRKYLNTFIEFFPNKDTICESKEENLNICLFILSKDESEYYNENSKISLSVYSSDENNKLYIKTLEYNSDILPNIKDNLSNLYSMFENLNSLQNQNQNLLSFDIKKNMYQVILVYSLNPGNIYLVNSINNTKNTVLSPYYTMITQLENGELKIDNIENIQKRFLSTNSEIISNSNAFCLVNYYYPKLTNPIEIEESVLKTITFGNSIELFTQLKNEKEYIFYITIDSFTENNDYYNYLKSYHNFELKGYFVNKQYILNKQQKNILDTISFSVEIYGKFDHNLLSGNLKISKDDLKFAKEINMDYLYIELNPYEDNLHLYNQIKGKVYLHEINNLYNILPNNMYFFESLFNYDKNEKIIYPFESFDNSISSKMEIEFISNNKDNFQLSFQTIDDIELMNNSNNDLSKSSKNLKIDGPKIKFGKFVYIIELTRNIKRIYVVIFQRKDDYIFKYQIFQDNEDINKFNTFSNDKFITIKTQYPYYSIKIPKLEINNKNIITEYYLYDNLNDLNNNLVSFKLNNDYNYITVNEENGNPIKGKYQIVLKINDNSNIIYQIYTLEEEKTTSENLFKFSVNTKEIMNKLEDEEENSQNSDDEKEEENKEEEKIKEEENIEKEEENKEEENIEKEKENIEEENKQEEENKEKEQKEKEEENKQEEENIKEEEKIEKEEEKIEKEEEKIEKEEENKQEEEKIEKEEENKQEEEKIEKEEEKIVKEEENKQEEEKIVKEEENKQEEEKIEKEEENIEEEIKEKEEENIEEDNNSKIDKSKEEEMEEEEEEEKKSNTNNNKNNTNNYNSNEEENDEDEKIKGGKSKDEKENYDHSIEDDEKEEEEEEEEVKQGINEYFKNKVLIILIAFVIFVFIVIIIVIVVKKYKKMKNGFQKLESETIQTPSHSMQQI